jgi:hypothetical protein
MEEGSWFRVPGSLRKVAELPSRRAGRVQDCWALREEISDRINKINRI